jgi:hypothetical protein
MPYEARHEVTVSTTVSDEDAEYVYEEFKDEMGWDEMPKDEALVMAAEFEARRFLGNQVSENREIEELLSLGSREVEDDA